MNSQIDETLLDSIVAGVLDRLRATSAHERATPSERSAASGASSTPTPVAPIDVAPLPVVLTDRVITEAVLEAKLDTVKAVRFHPKAVLTPSARDFLRSNGIEWAYARPNAEMSSSGGTWAALIVRTAPSIDRILDDLMPGVRRELLGCPDDAATLAIAEIARGSFAQAIILAEQVHRAACLANRHSAVKAVAVRDVSDVAAIRKQLRANVWCIDPDGRNPFELRNLLKAMVNT